MAIPESTSQWLTFKLPEINILNTVFVQNSVAKFCSLGSGRHFSEKPPPDGPFIQRVHGGNLNVWTLQPSVHSVSVSLENRQKILQDYTGCKMNFLQKRTDVCLSSSRDKRLVCVSSPANCFCSCVPAQNRGLYCPVTPVTDSLPLKDELQL